LYEHSDGEKTPGNQEEIIEKDEEVANESNVNQNGLFDYLSKTHISSKKKLDFLALQKLKIEMATCTFKPVINSTRNNRVDS
jgi:hypothetical protein